YDQKFPQGAEKTFRGSLGRACDISRALGDRATFRLPEKNLSSVNQPGPFLLISRIFPTIIRDFSEPY
ncbi:MAG: hypothetical protein M0R18_13585, partial [Deltaproteobacteria bacterium]|nr:hypothetical protein [Deltaproteobacteria bacterium]